MKKTIIGLSLILVVGLFSALTYADRPVVNQAVNMDYRSEDSQEFRQDRLQHKKDNLKKMLDEGFITESIAKDWEEHYTHENEFHGKRVYLNDHCVDGSNRGMGMRRNHMMW